MYAHTAYTGRYGTAQMHRHLARVGAIKKFAN